ncbi:MAG: hypothetical protein KBD76_15475 [Bacteriovorax sp.]|nr:hypothetical protein [Bacteriovorax sp.]
MSNNNSGNQSSKAGQSVEKNMKKLAVSFVFILELLSNTMRSNWPRSFEKHKIESPIELVI